MSDSPFHLLLCDYDAGLAFITGEVFDAAPWIDIIDELRDSGKNVTCQSLPSGETVFNRQAAEKFCTKHGLRLTEKPLFTVGKDRR